MVLGPGQPQEECVWELEGRSEAEVMSMLGGGYKPGHWAALTPWCALAASPCMWRSQLGTLLQFFWTLGQVHVQVPGKVFPSSHLHHSSWRLGAGERLKWVPAYPVDLSFTCSHMLHGRLCFPIPCPAHFRPNIRRGSISHRQTNFTDSCNCLKSKPCSILFLVDLFFTLNSDDTVNKITDVKVPST